MTLQTQRIERNVGPQVNTHDIPRGLAVGQRATTLDLLDVVGALDDRFGPEKSHGQLIILSWRPHGDRQTAEDALGGGPEDDPEL